MITLHMLEEKQQKINKRNKKLLVLTSTASVLFFISLFVTAYINTAVYALILLAFVFMFSLFLCWINITRLDNNTDLIIKNIQRVLYSELSESDINIDAEILLADCNKDTDEYLCFWVEAYGSNVTYNDLALLASIFDPVIADINRAIRQRVVIYYRIDNIPFDINEY